MSRPPPPARPGASVLLVLLSACALLSLPSAAAAAPTNTTTAAAAPAACVSVASGVVACSKAPEEQEAGKVLLGGQVVAGLSCKPVECPSTGSGGRRRRKLSLIFGSHGLAVGGGGRPQSCFQVCAAAGNAGARAQNPKALLASIVYASKAGIPDYGAPCTSGAQCASGVCGNSCSKRDWRAAATTSCLCPTNGQEPSGCCGCLAYDPSAPPGAPAVLGVCPSGDVTTAVLSDDGDGDNGSVALRLPLVTMMTPAPSPALAPLPRGTVKSLYARLAELGAMDDELVEAGAPQKYIKEENFTASAAARVVAGVAANDDANNKKLPFGAPCSRHDECRWGICGTGCDCDSSVEERCSCNAQSGFPFRTCGGCNRGTGDKGAVVGACPPGVVVTTFGGGEGEGARSSSSSSSSPVWLPKEGEQVSPSYCILLALEVEVNGLRLWSEGGEKPITPPRACDRELWAAVAKAAEAEKKKNGGGGDNDKDNFAAVEALFERLATAACKTPMSDPTGCKCDYAALMRAFGPEKVDPAVCRRLSSSGARRAGGGGGDDDKAADTLSALLLLHKKNHPLLG